MGNQETKLRFQVGDHVRILDNPNKNAPLGWSPDMNNYCGRSAIITKLFRSMFTDRMGYQLDIDGGRWKWDDENLESDSNDDVDIPESTESLSYLFAVI